MSYCQTIRPQVFLTYPNIHKNPNLTVTFVQRGLLSWQCILPPILYVQLDNTARENKNWIVFGYLNMLLDRGIFKTIKVNFLLVGYTHDHIDQMFSMSSKTLASSDAFTFLQYESLSLEPIPQTQRYNIWMKFMIFKGFSVDGDGTLCRVLAPLNNISFNHVYLIKRGTSINHN